MVSSGASNVQALFGTTRYAAELLRIDGDYGTLKAGKYAALLLFDENPLADV
ncbi:MAG TPA: amidohydrolase family protein [Candidatus Ligilactobacillus excrementavium]|nr:amidohydrolase family protein [Candidatus Ligilactobacillus excrementavium]